MTFSEAFIDESVDVLTAVNTDVLEEVAQGLAAVRDRGGRLFILGVGGSAGHASHAVNDFRKLCGFEAYTPTDNVSELTARANDEGWDTTFAEWLKGSRLGAATALLVFSVGGGSRGEARLDQPGRARSSSARECGAAIFGIVGRDGGYTAQVGRCLRDHPAAVCRPRDAAHRGPVRRHLAPAGLSPGAGPGDDALGVAAMTGPSHRGGSASSAGLVSSAATSSSALLAGDQTERLTVYDNFSSGREWHLAALRGDPTADRRQERRARPRGPGRRHGWARHGDPPRVQPGHRPRGDRPGDRLRPGDPAHPPRRRGSPPQRRGPGALRLRQRRVRRSR